MNALRLLAYLSGEFGVLVEEVLEQCDPVLGELLVAQALDCE